MSVPEPQLTLHAPPAAAAGGVNGAPLRIVATPPASEAETLEAWLDLVCRMIPNVARGFVGLDPAPNDRFARSACWPAGAGDTSAAMLATGRHALQRDSDSAREAHAASGEIIARRLALPPGRSGVLVIEVGPIEDTGRDALTGLLEWADAWFALVMRAPSSMVPRDLTSELMQAGLAAPDLPAAATAMAALIAASTRAERVSIGLNQREQLRLVALSHTANFDPRMQLSRDILAAMEEALDEDGSVTWPPAGHGHPAPGVLSAHARLAAGDAARGACSVVLRDGDTPMGALTLEHRSAERTADALALLEYLAPALARVLEVKQALERPVYRRLIDAAGEFRARLTGPGRIGTKLVTAAATAALAVLCLVDGDLKVAAPATLEGRVHRIMTAPLDGYIAAAPARAGDAVKTGDVLAVVDTRSLEFERRRWINERSEFENAHRRAVASLDRAEATITRAQLGRAASQLALVEEQLARATLTAPFDGLVVSGDLSRSMGAPVSRGDVLFELAPLDDYRVALEVDEGDIGEVAVGQTGDIAFTALPGQRFAFTVDKVIGVATVNDGRNVFSVEARLVADPAVLRPGMRGVGKIRVDQRPLLSVWTHHLVDRVHLWLWSRTL